MTSFAYLLLLIFLSEFLLHGQFVDELQILFHFLFLFLHRLLVLAPDFIELLIELRSPLLFGSRQGIERSPLPHSDSLRTVPWLVRDRRAVSRTLCHDHG